jgi:uncharacterized alkaline shock family protein YloU
MENDKKDIKVDNEKEEITINQGEANIQISDDVVAVIAGMAASEVQGVAEMAGGFAGGITEVLSGKKNMAKGIKVEIQEKETKIDVNIIVEYGARIPDVAFEIQKRVKKSVENMTGLNVSEVNVHVQGVSTPSDDKKETIKEDNTEKEEKKETKTTETKPEKKVEHKTVKKTELKK